jgi:hypothetical protein
MLHKIFLSVALILAGASFAFCEVADVSLNSHKLNHQPSTFYTSPANMTTGAFPAGVTITGVTDGSFATAGNIGEMIQQIVPSNVPTSATDTWVTISTITLTPGCWEIFAVVISSGNGAEITTGSNIEARISTTTANISQNTNNNTLGYDWLKNSPVSTGTPTTVYSDMAMPTMINVISTTVNKTYYVLGKIVYTAGSPQWYGSMKGIRIR